MLNSLKQAIHKFKKFKFKNLKIIEINKKTDINTTEPRKSKHKCF